MANGDPRIDQYIAKANDFAKPILTRIRETVRAACPDVEETLKRSSPTFMYGGRILCGMAAFKEHCHLHFWRGESIAVESGASVNDLLRGLKRVSDLPSKRAHGLRQASDAGPRCGRGRTEGESRPKAGIGSAGCSVDGVEAKQEGSTGVREVQPEPSPRIHRVDHGRQAR